MSPTFLAVLLTLPGDPPLDPDGDEARRLLERELSAPRYQPSLPERLREWLDNLLSRGPDAGNPLSIVARSALVVLLLVVAVVLIWVVVRLRRDPRAATSIGTVFDDVRRSAAEHRALARTAAREEDWDRAVVEGMRAISAGLVERALVEDSPAATAHEVAAAAAPRFPSLADRLAGAARVFDETRYGGRPAGRRQADDVLELEGELTAAAPTSASVSGPVTAVPR